MDQQRCKQAIQAYIDLYSEKVILWFGPPDKPAARDLQFIAASPTRLAYLSGLPQEASDAYRWFIADGLPRLQSLGDDLAVSNLAQLGALVRLCDERINMLEIAGSDTDDWVHDNPSVIATALRERGFIAAPSMCEDIAIAYPQIVEVNCTRYGKSAYGKSSVYRGGVTVQASSANHELAWAA